MNTWDEFVEESKKISKTFSQDYEEMHALAKIIIAIIDKRAELGISQRELASICELPQSTIARIETNKIKPNLFTILKIMKPLGLTLEVDNL